jgi:hypothetical protein
MKDFVFCKLTVLLQCCLLPQVALSFSFLPLLLFIFSLADPRLAAGRGIAPVALFNTGQVRSDPVTPAKSPWKSPKASPASSAPSAAAGSPDLIATIERLMAPILRNQERTEANLTEIFQRLAVLDQNGERRGRRDSRSRDRR